MEVSIKLFIPDWLVVDQTGHNFELYLKDNIYPSTYHMNFSHTHQSEFGHIVIAHNEKTGVVKQDEY